MKRSREKKNNGKASLSHALISGIQLPFSMVMKSKRVHAGLLACIALGAGALGSGFRAASSSGIQENQGPIGIGQFNGNSDREATSEVENLKKQLQSSARQLKEYQAHLFRSSHPKDQAAIAELGRAVAEKEKLNSKLSASLKSLEADLASTRKQIANLEITSDALNSLLLTHRANSESENKHLNDQLNKMAKSHDADKQALIAQIASYQAEQQLLSKNLEEKTGTLNQLSDTLAKNNVWSAQLLKDMQELKTLYIDSLHTHHAELKAQGVALFEELQAHGIVSEASQKVFAGDAHTLSLMLENERLIADKLNDELLAARHALTTHEVHILELENNNQKALTLADDLTAQLGELHASHSATQHELAAALQQLEETKSSLLDELHISKEQLQAKLSEIESLELQVGDMVAALEGQHQHTLVLGQRLIQSMRDTAAANAVLDKFHASSERDQDIIKAFEEALEDKALVNADLEKQSAGLHSELTVELSRSQHLEQAVQSAFKEKDQLQAQLHDSNGEMAALKDKAAMLVSQIESLEKDKEQLAMQIKDHSQIIAQHEAHKETLSDSLLENEDALASAHTYYQSAIDEIGQQVEELEAKLKIEEERSSLLQVQLETALAAVKSDELRLEQLDGLNKEMVGLKLKLMHSEQLNTQLVEAASILEEKYQSKIDKILAQLDEREAQAAELREDILMFSQKQAEENEYQNELEKRVSNLSLLLEEKEYALATLEEAARSAEDNVAKRDAATTAHQQSLSQEVGRLKAELAAQNADKEHAHQHLLALADEHAHALSILEMASAEREADITAYRQALSQEIESLKVELAARNADKEHAHHRLEELAGQHADELSRSEDLNGKIKELTSYLESKESTLALQEEVLEVLSLKMQKLAIEYEESKRQQMEWDGQFREIAKSVDEKTQALDDAHSAMFIAHQLNQKLQEENNKLTAEIRRNENKKLYSSPSLLPILRLDE